MSEVLVFLIFLPQIHFSNCTHCTAKLLDTFCSPAVIFDLNFSVSVCNWILNVILPACSYASIPRIRLFFLRFFTIFCLSALSGIHKCGLALFRVVQKVVAGIKPLNLSPPLSLSLGSYSQLHQTLGCFHFKVPVRFTCIRIIFLGLAKWRFLFPGKAVVISFVFTLYTIFKWILFLKIFTSATMLIEFSVNICKAALQTSLGSPLIQCLERNEEWWTILDSITMNYILSSFPHVFLCIFSLYPLLFPPPPRLMVSLGSFWSPLLLSPDPMWVSQETLCPFVTYCLVLQSTNVKITGNSFFCSTQWGWEINSYRLSLWPNFWGV